MATLGLKLFLTEEATARGEISVVFIKRVEDWLNQAKYLEPNGRGGYRATKKGQEIGLINKRYMGSSYIGVTDDGQESIRQILKSHGTDAGVASSYLPKDQQLESLAVHFSELLSQKEDLEKKLKAVREQLLGSFQANMCEVKQLDYGVVKIDSEYYLNASAEDKTAFYSWLEKEGYKEYIDRTPRLKKAQSLYKTIIDDHYGEVPDQLEAVLSSRPKVVFHPGVTLGDEYDQEEEYEENYDDVDNEDMEGDEDEYEDPSYYEDGVQYDYDSDLGYYIDEDNNEYK